MTTGTTQSASALARRARVAAWRACSKRVIRYPLSESSSPASVASNRSDQAVGVAPFEAVELRIVGRVTALHLGERHDLAIAVGHRVVASARSRRIASVHIVAGPSWSM